MKKEKQVPSINDLLENRSFEYKICKHGVGRKSIVKRSPICNFNVIQSVGCGCHFFIGDQFWWRKCCVSLGEEENVGLQNSNK